LKFCCPSVHVKVLLWLWSGAAICGATDVGVDEARPLPHAAKSAALRHAPANSVSCFNGVARRVRPKLGVVYLSSTKIT
jgi:hypothetical protein